MTLTQMEYVVALDTYRHFVTASQKCFVTQPTLTMQLKKLEEEVGTLLFDRSKKPLEPTAIGTQFIAKAREILREVKQLEQIVSEERYTIEGTFTIGIIPTLAPYLLPLFLAQFIAENPKTKLIIEELESLEMIKRIKDESIDLGIIVTPLQEKQLREIALFNEPFLVYLPAEHSLLQQEHIQAKDLQAVAPLVLTEGHCFRNQSLNVCQQNRPENMLKDVGFSYQSGSIETLKQLVDQGLGYTLIPELSLNKTTAITRVKRFAEAEPSREVSLVCHKSFAKERLIEKLRSSILAHIPEQMKSNKNYVRVRWRS